VCGMKKTGRYDVSASIETQSEPGSRARVLRDLLESRVSV
jgi:hypothetical protein